MRSRADDYDEHTDSPDGERERDQEVEHEDTGEERPPGERTEDESPESGVAAPDDDEPLGAVHDDSDGDVDIAERRADDADAANEQAAALDEHKDSRGDGRGEGAAGDDGDDGDEPACDTPDELANQEPGPDPVTASRLRRRRLAQQLIAGAAALSLIVAVWAAVSGSGPRSVVSIADSTSPSSSQAVQTTAPPAPKTLAQTIASTVTLPGRSPALAWPSRGQAAVDVVGMGSLGTYGSTETPVPIASVTKTMVAYVILTDHPLSAGDSGPTIIVTPAEAAAYAAERALGQSLVMVKPGEPLTERQALEALMLASADNVAKILARWDAGSVSAFVSKMNETAHRLGMWHTTYTDPSGYAPSTVSTATDQVILGEAAMQISALGQIVGESWAEVPVQGAISNYNTLLGQDGVDGIKTGSTDQAGGCLLFSATFTVGGRSETVIGAVLGQYLSSGSGFLDNTMYVARRLITSAQNAVVSSTIAVPGRQVAVVRQTGSADVLLGVSSAVTVVGLAGTTYQVSVSGDPSAATLTVTASGGSSVIASSPLTQISSAAPKRPGSTSDARLSAPDPFSTGSPTSGAGPV
jgi:D-alanyl-D-alanine carboxypeptidase (penicillin-binding protein 5/6)